MATQDIWFADGASYERIMGTWSRLVGGVFLAWLEPQQRQRWIDVGCGNGAFTELLVERCAPMEVQGIDPSEEQLAFARTRPAARLAGFQQGNAMALPFPEEGFDAAVMALVIFYAPEPAKAVAELSRVVRRGGTVATYIWDTEGGGSPTYPVLAEMRSAGLTHPIPPSLAASRKDVLLDLWTGAGLQAIKAREIVVQRTYPDFDDFWTTTLLQPNVGPAVAALPSHDAEQLRVRVKSRLAPGLDGSITCTARANAIMGYKPT